MKNVQKNADQGRQIVRRNERLDLTAGELKQLLDGFFNSPSTEGIYDAVVNAYYTGLATGVRNAKRGSV